MALLKPAKPSELPESQVEFREENMLKRWLTLAVYIILALAVAVLVVLAARWVYHRIHHPAKNTSNTSQQQKSNSKAANNSKASSPSASSTSNSSNSNSANKCIQCHPVLIRLYCRPYKQSGLRL